MVKITSLLNYCVYFCIETVRVDAFQHARRLEVGSVSSTRKASKRGREMKWQDFFPPTTAENEADHHGAQPLKALVFEYQARTFRFRLQRKGHDGVDLAASPAERQSLVLDKLDHLAINDAVKTRRGLRAELEFVPDPRREIIWHEPLRQRFGIRQRTPDSFNRP